MSEHTNLKNILEMCFANNGEFQWSFIDAYFEDNDESLSDVEKFSIFCDKVIDNFNSFDFSDVVLVARIIDMIIISIDPDIPRENDTFKESVLNVMSRTLEQRQESELFHICSDLDFAYVAKTMFTGRVDLMKILVRYGVCNSSSTREEGNETPIASGNRRASNIHIPQLPDGAAVMNRPAVVYNNISQVQFSSDDFNRRTRLIIAAVKSANEKWVSMLYGAIVHPRKDDVSCFKLYFQAVQDPIITHVEAENVFYNIVSTDAQRLDINRILGMFRQCFPKSAGSYQPRSLRHISRCRVRECLRETGVLPHLVPGLKIPLNLKPLLLSDDEREFIN